MQIIKKDIEALINIVLLQVETIVGGEVVKVVVPFCSEDRGQLATNGKRKMSFDKQNGGKNADGKVVMYPYWDERQAMQIIASLNNTPGLHAEEKERRTMEDFYMATMRRISVE